MLLIVASLGGEAKRLRDEMQRKLRCLFGRCVTFGGRKVEFSSDLGVACLTLRDHGDGGSHQINHSSGRPWCGGAA